MNNELLSPASATSLPDLLRGLRRAQRLTQSEAARAAGVSRVTLTRWESGVQRPRLPELEALLAALGARERERRQAHGFLATPGAVAQAQAAVAQMADRTGLSPLPSGADLLRALRLRRGWSPDKAAGVSTATLRRWEAGDSWPDAARLHALCWALGAYAEEVSALTVGNFAPRTALLWADPEPAALDHQLDGLRQRVAQGNYALMDLHCLTLEAQAWHLAVQGDIRRRLLSRAHQVHAMAVTFRGDQQGAKRLAEQAMAVWPESFRREREGGVTTTFNPRYYDVPLFVPTGGQCRTKRPRPAVPRAAPVSIAK